MDVAEGGDMAKVKDVSAAGVAPTGAATGVGWRTATRTPDGISRQPSLAKSSLASSATSGPRAKRRKDGCSVSLTISRALAGGASNGSGAGSVNTVPSESTTGK